MPLISDSNGVLRSQEARTFIDRFQKSINARLTGMETKEALTLLYDLRGNLIAEESAVNRTVLEIEALLHRLAVVSSSEDIADITASFHQLAAEQFRNRASVSTFHSHYSRFMEMLIVYAITTAAAMLHSEGMEIPENSWCALVSGELGRGEPGRRRLGQIILLADDSAGFSPELFNLFAYRTLAILDPLLAPGGKRPVADRRKFWSGTATAWSQLVAAGLHEGKNPAADGDTLADENLFADTVTMVADVRPLCGALPLAEAVVADSRQKVALELHGERFRQFAKQTTAMPVAIGIFGRFKTVKTGKHRGEFPLEEMAITPLVAATRALAVAHGITETATIARITGILATGDLGVALADRLLHAYHDFMKTLIELELSATTAGEKIFFNPDSLDELSRERFRNGLEEITTLQRIVYQQLVEAD
jgi:signal-transduction protein with cAMP-binding, CBS, and nucleotidyltransferase domain